MQPILHLWLFGSFQAELDLGSGPCPLPPLPTRLARALLARLALAHPQPVPRAQLTADLFPRAGAESASHHLRTTLYYLRRAIPNLLISNEAQICFEKTLALEMDVSRFEADSQPGAGWAALSEAIGLYRGYFLDSPQEGWAEMEARRLYRRYLDVLQRMVALSQASGNLGEGLEAARRWAAEEPWEIKAHRALIAAHAALEDYRSAEAQVARARQVLNGEWGQVTDEAFEALARQVKTLAVRSPAAPRASAGGPLKSPPAGHVAPTPRGAGIPQFHFDTLPLVGRAAELVQLWEAWTQARQGESRALILEGPAGIGKTRLVSELAVRARLMGGVLVLFGAAEETTAKTPLGLLRSLLAHLTEPDLARLCQACAGLNPVVQNLLANYLPELASRLPETDALAPLEGPAELARRQTALSALAQALLGQGPVLWVLEDTHLADEETLAFVQGVVAQGQPPRRCLVVLTRRPSRGGSDMDWPVIRLAPLREEESGLLLNQALKSAQAGVMDGETAQKIARLSTGNPLFALEILRGLVEQGNLCWDRQRGWQLLQAQIPLPDSVASLLAQRLGALSGSARELATLLAVLGRPADDTLLDRLFQGIAPTGPHDPKPPDSESARLAAQVELLDRQVLVEQDERLWFDHAWLREALLASVDAPRRAVLHGQVANALGVLTGLDRAERMQHYLESAQWAPALEDALAVAESALSGQNLPQMASALRGAEQALSHASLPDSDPRQWRYLRLAERYHSQVERGSAWQQALNHLLAAANASGQVGWQVEALVRKMSGLYLQGQFEDAVQTGRAAAQAAHAAHLPAQEAEARELLVSIFNDWGKIDDAWTECQALLEAAEASQDERLQCLALNGLIQCHLLAGQVDDAARLFIRLGEHPYIQNGADWAMLRQMAVFSMAGRAYEPGLAWLRASAQQAQRVGDVLGMVSTQAYLCFELANLGRYAEVQAIGESVLPLACQLKESYQEGFLYYSLAKAAFFCDHDPARALELVERGTARTEADSLIDPLTGLLGLEAQICLAQGWLSRARRAIERAEQLSPPSGVVFIDHIAAQVWLAAGQPEKACPAAQLAVERAHDLGFLAIWACEMLWNAAQILAQVTGNGQAREVRMRAYQRFADDLTRLEGPAARRLLIQANPAHRDLVTFTGNGSCRIVFLPEADAPTGRPLREDELAPVVWTQDEPGEPDLASPAGRQARLQRLCQAALDQGAVATLEALSDFLASSPRTLQRDLRALREGGVKVQTRGGTKE